MSKCHELMNKKKTGGSDLDHPRAVNSNVKVILTVCLSVCMCECVRVSKSVRACLLFCHPAAGNTLFLLINLSECPNYLGAVSVFVCLSVCQPWHPCPGLPQTSFSLCLKYDFFRKTILTILNMLSVDHAFCERLYLYDF